MVDTDTPKSFMIGVSAMFKNVSLKVASNAEKAHTSNINEDFFVFIKSIPPT